MKEKDTRQKAGGRSRDMQEYIEAEEEKLLQDLVELANARGKSLIGTRAKWLLWMRQERRKIPQRNLDGEKVKESLPCQVLAFLEHIDYIFREGRLNREAEERCMKKIEEKDE